MSRRRYIYTQGGQPLPEPIEVDQDFTGAERRAQTMTEGIVHGNNVSPEGIDISSRKKRREYMKASGVADHGDFTNHLAKARAERDRFYTGKTNDKARRDAIGRALYESRRK